MKQKLQLLLCIIGLLSYININAQTAVAEPVATTPQLLWENPDGTSGFCSELAGAVCSTTICLGESICFSYEIEMFPLDYPNYSYNHNTISFSDGGSIVIENTHYSGPNPTGCVNYAPTTTGVISVTGLNTSPFLITVLPNTPPVLSANISPQNDICEGSQVCAQSLTTPNANYSFSSATDLGCFNGIFCTTPNTSAFCFPVGTHQILYTVNAGHTCSNTAIYNVNVVPTNLNLTVTQPDACSNNYCFNVAPSSSCNFGNLSYTWDIVSSDGANTIYYQTNTLQSICVNIPPGTYNVFVYTSDGVSFANTTIIVPPVAGTNCACVTCNPIGTTGVISTSPASNQRYCINNNITINGPITFASSEFKINPNVTITVANNAVLTIDRSHLYAGTNLWNGIVVQNGGKLNIINNSLIEDAVEAVSIINHTTQTNILTVDASIFNRNVNAIKIQGYNQNITPFPFIITKSLFTCRIITDCSTIAGWPLTANIMSSSNTITTPLQSPYINDVLYPVVNLKAPYANLKALRGLLLIDVGKSTVTTTSGIYNEIAIGTLSGANAYNIFDNQWFGIDARNSNLSVVNCIFQNGFNFPGNYSTGITTVSSANINNRMQVSTTSNTNNNKFFNVTRAVKATNCHELAVNYCEMYNTGIYSPMTPALLTSYGVSATSNHYNAVNMNNNTICNIVNGLVFNGTIGAYSVGTTIGTGQFLGSINANNNSIRSHVIGYTPNPSLHYGFKAITLSTIAGAPAVVPANQIVYTNNNIINDYENGISASNWPSHGVSSTYNNITIRNSSTNTQYGIIHSNNNPYIPANGPFSLYGIVFNYVTANSISNNPNNYAIRVEQNNATAVTCNTVSNTYKGITFDATNIGSFLYTNDFTGNNHYGFVLQNSGVIGQQGASDLGPIDNRWLGSSWISPNFKTATLNSTAQNSKLYIRLAPSDFNPNGSGFMFPNLTGNDYFYNGLTSGTLQQGNQATYNGCSYNKPINVVDLLEEIAKNQAPSGIEHAVARFVAKSQLFEFLKNNPDFLNKSGILKGFYNSNKNKYRDIFVQIEENIVIGNINQAKNDLVAFNPQNTSETKHKQFFTLLLKHQDQAMVAADELDLLNLANGCPATDGAFVHKARTLYNVAFDKNESFTDNCNYTENNARKGNFDEEQPTEVFGNDMMLYPNPSSTGEVFVFISDATIQNIEVTVHSANGLAILNQNTAVLNNIAKLNIKAANGVYIVTITNPQTNERVIKKLVIQK